MENRSVFINLSLIAIGLSERKLLILNIRKVHSLRPCLHHIRQLFGMIQKPIRDYMNTFRHETLRQKWNASFRIEDRFQHLSGSKYTSFQRCSLSNVFQKVIRYSVNMRSKYFLKDNFRKMRCAQFIKQIKYLTSMNFVNNK